MSNLKPPRPLPLGQLESLVMRFLWPHAPVTAEQVRAGLAAEHPMKDATVRTLLRRLEEKGYVSHRVDGRTFLCSGKDRPEKVAAGAIRRLLDRFCNGSVEQILIGMVDHDVVTPGQLSELARKIGKRRKERE